MVEGDFVFTAPYQRCDVWLVKMFLHSDAICLPTKDYETAVNRGAPSLLYPSRSSEARAEPRSPRSLIASAEAERRQQLDFPLLIPEKAEKYLQRASPRFQVWC